jgi:hypothetical protein
MMKAALKSVGFGALVALLAAGCGPNPLTAEIDRYSRLEAEIDRASCKFNIQMIGSNLAMWGAEHDGGLPATLSELYPDYMKDVSIFVCPSTRHRPGEGTNIDEWSDYVYVKGLRWVSEPEEGTTPALVVYEKDGNHKDGRHELYTDGTVKWKPLADQN